MLGILCAALTQLHGNELVALEDFLADEQRLVFRRGDLGTQARGLALVGHDDTGHRVHILFERHIAPDWAPETGTRNRDHHTAVLGLEHGEFAVVESALQVLK